MQGRASYLKGGTRPQAMLWSDNPGTLEDGYYVPQGDEGTDFIIVSDHNRSEINFSNERIETRQRMVNGGMRSYWIADKLKISSSWNRLPSRPFDEKMLFLENGQPAYSGYQSYTVDGAAGGVDMLSWYETHPGSFYLFLSYDKYRVNGIENYNRLQTYSQVIKVYFSAFDYNVEKRSGGGFDFWTVNVSMEEA
jgi:hypothetical protein